MLHFAVVQSLVTAGFTLSFSLDSGVLEIDIEFLSWSRNFHIDFLKNNLHEVQYKGKALHNHEITSNPAGGAG